MIQRKALITRPIMYHAYQISTKSFFHVFRLPECISELRGPSGTKFGDDRPILTLNNLVFDFKYVDPI